MSSGRRSPLFTWCSRFPLVCSTPSKNWGGAKDMMEVDDAKLDGEVPSH